MGGQSPTQILISLAGEIALVLWSVHFITGAVTRAFGSRLRHVLAGGLNGRVRAFVSGLVVTAGLQSSTATALMISSFATAGAISLEPALAMMLGANVGTTLIVLFVSFDAGMLAPLLLLLGLIVSKRAPSLAAQETGKALFGLGLMLLSLKLLQTTMQPVEHSALLRSMMSSLSDDPIVALIIAAALAWALHSSVAAVILVMSLGSTGVIAGETMLAMVFGCNLGSAMNPLVQSWGGPPEGRRLPIGNVVNRVVGCAVGLAAAPWLWRGLASLGLSPAMSAAFAHLAFNLALAAAFLPVLGPLARALIRIVPDAEAERDPARPLYLDQKALDKPSVALANATREVLRMADVVDAMLRQSAETFASDDARKVAVVCGQDDVLDALFNQIQLYVGAISHEQLTSKDEERLHDVLTLAINLEHIGDIIEKSLMQMAGKRIREQRRLPASSVERIRAMHERLCSHLRLAVAVFISGDEDTARRLVYEKEMFRRLEQDAISRQLDEMRTGRAELIKTSAIELDVTRDLKRIDAHIATTVHNLLERGGVLQSTRLVRAGS